MDPGYAILDGVFARTEMDAVLRNLDADPLPRSKAGARHILGVPVVRDLASDPRLLEIARGFVGRGAVPFRATLFDKSPAANWLVVWHQDTALPLRVRVASRASRGRRPRVSFALTRSVPFDSPRPRDAIWFERSIRPRSRRDRMQRASSPI